MALTPMMWDHVKDIYEAMLERSKEEDIDKHHDDDDPKTHKVYEGFLTSLFGELGKPAPYYTAIMTALKKMGCVEQLRRGGGSAPSKWIMCHPPTESGYMAYVSNRNPTSVKRSKIDGLEQRLQTLTNRVQAMEEYLQQGPDLKELAKKG